MGVDQRKITRRAVAGLAAAAVLFVGLAVLVSGEDVPGLIEVEARGNHVLPDLPREVEVARLRVAETFTIHVDLTRGVVEDAVTGFFLTIMATAAFMAGMLLASRDSPRPLVRFYLISAAAIGFLAADELLSLHETVGHNIRPLVPGMEKPDNLVTFVYAVLALAALVVFRRVLWRRRPQRVLFSATAVLFLIAVAFDVLSARGEEPAEVLASACAGVGFLTMLADDLRDYLDLGGPAEPARERAPAGSREPAGA